MRRPSSATQWGLGFSAALLIGCPATSVAEVLTVSNPYPPPVSQAAVLAPFTLSVNDPARSRAQDCLAAAVFYEAADQPLAGRQAVAQVVLNRLRHPRYPKSVCGVVFQGAALPGCQFTFACDGSLRRRPDAAGWLAARQVAADALDGFVAPAVGTSTHYHALYVRPSWSAGLVATSRIGAHQFYRFPGERGEPASFTGLYAGSEPIEALDTQRFATVARASESGARNPRFVLARPAPQAVAITIWGLGVATVTPSRGGVVTVTTSAPS